MKIKNYFAELKHMYKISILIVTKLKFQKIFELDMTYIWLRFKNYELH